MKITDDVRAVLEKGIIVDGSQLTITAELERKLYLKVSATLLALGGKWSKGAKAHTFDDAIADRIEQALVRGEVTTAQDVGFFPTPEKLAKRMAKFVVPKTNSDVRVLEPSAGQGALIEAVLQRGASVTALEWDQKRRHGLANRFAGDRVIVLHTFPPTSLSDFMAFTPVMKFAAIIANPPFCKVGKGDHIDHLLHMLDLLDPDGPNGGGLPGSRLACVMPASLLFREDRRYREARVAISTWQGRIEPIPRASFVASGTGVNTCVVLIGEGDF